MWHQVIQSFNRQPLKTNIMRPVLIILFALLLLLQHKLWLGDGNIIQWIALQKKLLAHEQHNDYLVARNKALEANIRELKSGDQALEEEARYELGMIKKSEEFYQFID